MAKKLADLVGLMTFCASQKLASQLPERFVEVRDQVEDLERLIADHREVIPPQILADSERELASARIRYEALRDAFECGTAAAAVGGLGESVAATPERVSGVSAESASLMRLKPMKLMAFDGDIRAWRPFWEQFRAMVHERPYSATEKFVYLRNCIKGRPLKLLDGYTMTAQSYPDAVRVLVDRYGNPAKLVELYYRDLAELPRATSAEGDRTNLDAVRKIISNLSTVGSEVDQEMVKGSILRKFTKDTRRFALRSLVKNACGTAFTLDQLLEALSEEVAIEEMVERYDEEGATEGTSGVKHFSARRKTTATTATLVAGASKSACVFCASGHKSTECRQYGTLAKRRARLSFKKLCFLCLKPGHLIAECPKREAPCPHCRRKGHSAPLCVALLQQRGQTAKKREEASGTFLQTVSCHIESAVGLTPVRAILDTASKHSYVVKRLARRLKLEVKGRSDLNVCCFGSADPISIESEEVRLTLTNRSNTSRRTYTFRTTPCITGGEGLELLPSVESALQILPAHLQYADASLFETDRSPLEVLIGSDVYYDVVLGEQKRLPCGVVLLKTIFGVVPAGKIRKEGRIATVDSPPSSSLAVSTTPSGESLEVESGGQFDPNVLTNLWSLDVLGIKSTEIVAVDDLVLQNFRDTVRFEGGRYVVRWPWKQMNPSLPCNIRMAMARLKSLLTRTSASSLAAVDELFREQLSLGMIEVAPMTTPYLTHYLPHRPIFRSGKIRIVYDASANTKTGHSLNDLMHRGPALVEDLVGLLLNFRLHAVGVIADIEKAFLQIELNEVDRDAVRFLWVKNVSAQPTRENLTVFRFRRVPFGVIASPFLLNIVLQELLTAPPSNEYLLSGRKRFYVDNLVSSLVDTTAALSFSEALSARLLTAGFNLRDWASNDESLLRALPQSKLAKPEEIVSVLGLNWNKRRDVLSIKLETDMAVSIVTKRSVLKFLASIYDPLGLCSPCVLDLKLFVQECWKEEYRWDSPLPANMVAKWLKLLCEAKEISVLEVPRRVWDFTDEGSIGLHVFCDASKKAFACCAYLTYSSSRVGQSASTLIYSKVRIAPPKERRALDKQRLVSANEREGQGVLTPPKLSTAAVELTIPRLELLAVLIGKRASGFLTSHLDVSVTETIIWTDATTVLQWLNTSTVLPTFVQNRITEIRRAPNLIFRYVPTESNPADIASRGCKASLLRDTDLWWHGPRWLAHKGLWPRTPDNTEVFVSPVVALIVSNAKYSGLLSDRLEKRFSSWNSYVRTFRNVISFAFMKARVSDPADTVGEFQRAERLLIIELQRKYLKKEYAKLKAKLQPSPQLELLLDEHGLIRCKGRLQNVKFPWDTIHPILLPRDTPLTDVYLRKIHVENHHIGPSHLLAKVRERFWIVRGRQKMQSIVHRCNACKRWDGGSFALPPVPPLPLVRVAEVAPFLHAGVDLFGPLSIRNGVDDVLTVWVSLFTCLVTRAVHLEIVRDLSADEFLLCLSRFVGRRGTPKVMISDNATNFVFAQRVVGQRMKSLEDRLDLYLTSNQIQWKFIPQYAPWYGGAYERMVALVKTSLKKSFGKALLDYVELSTALCEIENTINSRPLTYVSEEMLAPLTPNHFLRLRTVNTNCTVEVPPALPSTMENLVSAWGHTLQVVEEYWIAFRKLYLLSLRERHSSVHRPKKGEVSFSPKKGDVVLVKEPSAPRADWKMGKILSLDKRQALAHLRSRGKTILRSINQLFPLELSMERSAPESLGDSADTAVASTSTTNGFPAPP